MMLFRSTFNFLVSVDATKNQWVRLIRACTRDELIFLIFFLKGQLDDIMLPMLSEKFTRHDRLRSVLFCLKLMPAHLSEGTIKEREREREKLNVSF